MSALASRFEPLDRIALSGLRATGFHGVFDHERRDGQEFVVDVVLHLDTRAAAATDRLAETVDYGSLAVDLATIVRGDPVDLIETLAQRLAERCLRDPRVAAADVTVHKPTAPISETFADVAVQIHRRRERPVAAVLALGSNLGERLGTLQAAIDDPRALDGVQVTAVSPVVETDPVGGPEQPDYLNAVVEVHTTLTPAALLACCHRIEQRHGRVREGRWGARTLDIDLIAFGDLVLATEALQVPHPRAAGRAFVLVPWAQMDPLALLPGAGPVADLAHQAPDRSGLRYRPDLVVG